VVYSHIPKVVIEEEEVVDDSGGSGSEKGRVPKLKRSTSLPLNQSEAEKEVMREIEELVKSSEKQFYNYESILSLMWVVIDGLEERKGQRIPKYLDEGMERIVRVTCHNHPISTLSHPSFTNALLAIIPFNRDTIRVYFSIYLFL